MAGSRLHPPAGCFGRPLALAGVAPLAKGVKRLVFQHPEVPELLIKVLREGFVQKRFGPAGRLHNRRRRCLHYNYFLRELREYLVACARSPGTLWILPEVVGWVHTDLGLGLVVRKVRRPDGGLAPSLERLIVKGEFTQARQERLEAFLAGLLESDVVVDDLHPGNMVLTLDASGAECFVLIDGLGNSTVLPLKAHFRFFNRWSKRREFERLRRSVQALLDKRRKGPVATPP